MGATELATAVTNRINSPMLIALSNNDSSPPATTVNSARLLLACADALGKFEALTGIASDTSNFVHLSVLVGGVLYFLEMYKSREGAMVSGHGRQFFLECQSLRERACLLPSTNSVLVPSSEQTGSRPDMDRDRSPFKTPGYTGFESGLFSGDM